MKTLLFELGAAKIVLQSKHNSVILFTMVNTIRDETLRTLIAEWLERPPSRQLIRRETETLDLPAAEAIIAIVGPRRAGKTSHMLRTIDDLADSGHAKRQDILFLDFEDYRLRGFQPEDIERLLAAFQRMTGGRPRYLFFDEVQHLPLWSRVLRTLHNQQLYRIVVSGSNSELLGREIATELRGRYRDILMLPFSFREYLMFREIPFDIVSIHTPARGIVEAAFEDYLSGGGFPEAVTQPDASGRRRLLQNYYNTIFYRDILDRYAIKARDLLERTMAQFVENYATVFSISAFEKQLKGAGIAGSKRTIAQYLRFLEEAFFLVLIERFSWSQRSRLMHPRKAYLIDNGFAYLGEPFSENRGRLLENLVAVELFRRRQQSFFFKDRGECDFVLKEGTRLTTAVQVCWRLDQRTEKRELNGLNEAMKTLNIAHGLILTANEEGTRNLEGNPVRIIPTWQWLIGTE